ASGAKRWGGTAAATDSVSVFHAPQCGHLPSHLADVPPHSEQTYWLRAALAMRGSVVTGHGVAAVDAQHLTCDERRVTGEQEGDHTGDLIRACETPHWHARQDAPLFIAADGVYRAKRLGFDWAWRNGVHCDVIGREFQRPCARAGNECLFGGTIARMPGGSQPEMATDIHDATIATSLHGRGKRLGDLHGHTNVDVECFVQLGQFDLAQLGV